MQNQPAAPAQLPRELYALVALLCCAHIAFNGSRITTSLAAIKAGGGAMWVGILTAMFAFLPAFFSVTAGKLSDRVALHQPIVWGCSLIVASSVIAALEPMLGVLLLTAAGFGIGFMLISTAAQQAVGMFGGENAAMRGRAFSLMSLGYSISAFVGPMIAGLMIDHIGYQWAFAGFIVFPLLPLFFLGTRRVRLPIVPKRSAQDEQRVTDLLRDPVVRNVLIASAVMSIGWDLYGFMVPVRGSQLHLSATQIGSVLSVFGAAVFAVRFAMPWISKRFSEKAIIASAMAIAGAVFMAFPFLTAYGWMLALSFLLGLGLGSGQPMILSLLHANAPVGRAGELGGLRMSIVNTSQWTMPLLFGILSAPLGLTPIFFAIGVGMLGGGFFTRKALKDRDD